MVEISRLAIRLGSFRPNSRSFRSRRHPETTSLPASSWPKSFPMSAGSFCRSPSIGTITSPRAASIPALIAAAMGRVVSGVADEVLMPILGVVLPGGEWRNAQVGLSGANAIKYGDLIGRLLDFVIVAAVVYALAKAFIKEAPAPATRSCPE